MKKSNHAELFAALGRLDRILERATRAADSAFGGQPTRDPYRGLYVSTEDVHQLLTREPGAPLLAGQELEQAQPEFPRLLRLAERFELSAFDQDVVLLALAPEVDLRYERVCAYLHDDITRRRPTVDLALQILCAEREAKLAAHTRFAPDAPLLRHRVLSLFPDPSYPSPPLLAHLLKLDDAIVRFLINEHGSSMRMGLWAERRHPAEEARDASLKALPIERIEGLTRENRRAGRASHYYFGGAQQALKLRGAESLAFRLDVPLFRVFVERLPMGSPEFEEALDRIFRDAWLEEAIVYMESSDTLEQGPAWRRQVFSEKNAGFRGVLILSGEAFTAPPSWPAVSVAFPELDYGERLTEWSQSLQLARVAGPGNEALSDLATLHRLSADQIQGAVASAAEQTSLAGAGVRASDLFAAARDQSRRDLGPLAKRVEPVYQWSDLVLLPDRTAQLREISAHARYRHVVFQEWGFDARLSLGKGLSALFSGPPGTGKTMAAEVIANDLGLDLYKIDLSQVVSKYIGETEKNLAKVFHEAAMGNAILFFDECDALFGKRSEVKDAHDRYANIEIAYLLQKIDEYEGLCILATNLRDNLDPAFVRRLTFIVDFPFPDETSRRKIWEGIWPTELPRSRDVDFAVMAREFKLSGGSVKNVALAAAFLAAADPAREVRLQHIFHAVRREVEKSGRSLVPNPLGKAEAVS